MMFAKLLMKCLYNLILHMLSGLTRSDLIVSCMRFAPVFVLRLAQCGVPFKRADAQVLEGDPQQARPL